MARGSGRQRKYILVHRCFNPFLRGKDNKLWLSPEWKCVCQQRITLSLASAYVSSELAMFCALPSQPDGEQIKPACLSTRAQGYSAIVMMGSGFGNSPSSITDKEMVRAYIEKMDRAQEHIETYNALDCKRMCELLGRSVPEELKDAPPTRTRQVHRGIRGRRSARQKAPRAAQEKNLRCGV